MKRYIPSSRSSSSDAQTEFLDSLNTQAQKLLSELSQQFIRDLQSQATSALGSSDSDGSSGSASDGFSTFGRIFGTAARYLVTQPAKTTQSTVESARSQDSNAQFRLSQNQTMAEASQSLAKGNKNT